MGVVAAARKAAVKVAANEEVVVETALAGTEGAEKAEVARKEAIEARRRWGRRRWRERRWRRRGRQAWRRL